MAAKISKRQQSEWYRLDLSAIVYPTLQRQNFSSVYRISAVLTEPVQPEVLQHALDKVMLRFPTYKVAMRRGLFWRYLEKNKNKGPFVQPDINNPCQPMPFHSKDKYLVRAYYYDRRISLDVHHCLGDGTGGMCLFQTLVAEYLRMLGHSVSCGGYVMDLKQAPEPEELEDAYKKYATAKFRPPRQRERAYHISGTLEPFYTLNIICGTMSVAKVKEVASQYKVTISEYFNAVLMYALMQKQKEEHPYKIRPVKLAMPVNLRRMFPSKTLRNFITMVFPSIDPRLGDYTFEEIAGQVHAYMQYYINPKFLRGDITTNAFTRTHPVLRVVPLFIKDMVVRNFYRWVQDKNSSAGITNMGQCRTPKEMEKYIERMDIYMGQPFSPRTNCAIISYLDILTVNFASSIRESDVEKLFFRKLVEDGIAVQIETNRNMN